MNITRVIFEYYPAIIPFQDAMQLGMPRWNAFASAKQGVSGVFIPHSKQIPNLPPFSMLFLCLVYMYFVLEYPKDREQLEWNGEKPLKNKAFLHSDIPSKQPKKRTAKGF